MQFQMLACQLCSRFLLHQSLWTSVHKLLHTWPSIEPHLKSSAHCAPSAALHLACFLASKYGWQGKLIIPHTYRQRSVDEAFCIFTGCAGCKSTLCSGGIGAMSCLQAQSASICYTPLDERPRLKSSPSSCTLQISAHVSNGRDR